jgi:hypothetical protein
MPLKFFFYYYFLLRRLFLELAENDLIQKGKKEYFSSTSSSSSLVDHPSKKASTKLKSSSSSSVSSKAVKIYEWFIKQYSDFQTLMMSLLSSSSTEWSHALVVRTFLELMKIDSLIYENTSEMRYLIDEVNFPIESYRLLLSTLLLPFPSASNNSEQSKVDDGELDVDLLIMLKDEVRDGFLG